MKKLWIILGIVAVIIGGAAIVVMTGGTPEHSTKFKNALGSWKLDCRYVEANATEIPRIDMELSKSEMKQTIYVMPKKDKDGKPVKGKEKVDKNVTYNISNSSDGKFTASGDGETLACTFNYDEYAELLHVYYNNADGKEVHDIYVSKDAE